ncbi:hypothetical protein [Streptomyces sp. MA15]|uniref:hypothetical protein n=1 Tax=Streptomyces sp. MA15 TaxID=3055061 RepID=UPI0025AFA063|nr:hypothetical protein [Streptomyces sp. MA15]MDN3267081.1 hypothetical protein [Streptomyces sp. MA15]
MVENFIAAAVRADPGSREGQHAVVVAFLLGLGQLRLDVRDVLGALGADGFSGCGSGAGEAFSAAVAAIPATHSTTHAATHVRRLIRNGLGM